MRTPLAPLTSVIVMLSGALVLGGCSVETIDESESESESGSASECAESIISARVDTETNGLDLLVSQPLAASVEACTSPAEWLDVLVAHPETVGMDRLTRTEAQEYLAAVCELRAFALPEAGPLCAQAVDEGLIDSTAIEKDSEG